MRRDISSRLAELPKEPGVYFYKDARGEIIYVGKAAVLKNRVRSYFQSPAKLDTKTRILVSEIAAIDWLTTESEIDALFLESEMIKRYKPRYNIELRDDKHYLYIRINMRDQYPYVSLVRRPMDDGAEYFGPYIAGIRQALKYLRRIFPYSTHRTLPKRVCLQYHLGLCPGIEEQKITSENYKANVRKLMLYLSGKRQTLIKQLEKDMRAAARAERFEDAARLRNQIQSLHNLSKQVVFGDKELFDVRRDMALSGLQQLLGLKGLPRRIEAYDISHIAGTNNVASMTVFLNGLPVKGEYRKFRMRTPGNDDFAHMREVISRRFSGRNLEKWPKPDLVVIDGGKGQLAAALEVLAEKQLDIPTIGLAKRYETIIVKRGEVFEQIQLPAQAHALKLLTRIRDEAHRFAVTYHSLLRSKQQTRSRLDEIPGVGPATRKKLIRSLGSFKAVQTATQQELAAIVGPVKAGQIKQQIKSQVSGDTQ